MLSPSALFGALSRRAAPAAVAWLTLSAACSASQPASDPLGLSDDEIAALQPPVPTPPPRSPQNHERTIGPWPQGNAGLDGTVPTMPAGFGTKRIYLDPGHGAPGNHGNTGAYCHREEAFTLALAHDVAAVLQQLDGFEIHVARRGTERPTYEQRVAAATAWGADVYLSLHSDVRGPETPWSPTPGQECLHHDDSPGFSVLWSDTPASPPVSPPTSPPAATPPPATSPPATAPAAIALQQQRVALARTTARRLAARGFRPCHCWQYAGSYEADTQVPAVFVDRRPKRIYVLKASPMPAILIETHNALDRLEARRWNEAHTRRAFALALADTLYRALAPPTPARR